MLQKKRQHGGRCRWSVRVRKAAFGLAAGPGVRSGIDPPVLNIRPTPVAVEADALGERFAWRPDVSAALRQGHARRREGGQCGVADVLAIIRMHSLVRCAVKHNRRQRRRGLSRCAVAHGTEGRGEVARSARLQAGMYADCGKHISVLSCHQCGHRTAGRQPGDVDPAGVCFGMAVKHLLRHGGNHAGLTTAALLVAGFKPVPAAANVGLVGLLGVEHHALALLGQRVHVGANGKVLGILRAAVQQHDQRHGAGLAR